MPFLNLFDGIPSGSGIDDLNRMKWKSKGEMELQNTSDKATPN